MLLGSTLSWLGLLIGYFSTSLWVTPNSLLAGLAVLVTVSLWTVLSKLLVLLRLIPLIFLLWFLCGYCCLVEPLPTEPRVLTS